MKLAICITQAVLQGKARSGAQCRKGEEEQSPEKMLEERGKTLECSEGGVGPGEVACPWARTMVKMEAEVRAMEIEGEKAKAEKEMEEGVEVES